MKIVILGIQCLQQLQLVSSHTKTLAQNAPNTWLRHLQFPACAMCWLLRAPDKLFLHMLDSLGQWPLTACLFHSAQAATLLEFHVPLTNCFVCRWFCVVHGLKPPLYHHNWLSFGKFQETECFHIPCPHHVKSRLFPSGETCKYAMAPGTQKNLDRFSTYWYAPFCCLSWSLRSRVRKFRRDLWITLYSIVTWSVSHSTLSATCYLTLLAGFAQYRHCQLKIKWCFF